MFFSAYFTIITIATLTGFTFFYQTAKRNNIDPVVAIDLGIITSIFGILGARLFHIIFEMPSYYLEHPWDIFKLWQGGFVLYGGFILPAIISYIYIKHKKLNFANIVDFITPSVALGAGIGRIACVVQGCCYGKATNVPWAVVYHHPADPNTPIGMHIHPTQMYMVLSYFFIFFLILFIFKNGRRKKFNGQIFATFIVLESFFRFIIEYFRGDFRGSFFEPYLSTSQVISLTLFVSASIFLIKNYHKKRII